MVLLNQPAKCVICSKDYITNQSTAHPMTILIYCSLECEELSNEYLAEGNKVMEEAKKNDPQAFMRSGMGNEEVAAINSIKKLGVKFDN